MGVDKSYGSGYKNSGKSKASALKPGSMKKTAPAVAKARTLQSRNAAASPSLVRDAYNKKTVAGLKRAATDVSNAIFGKPIVINGQRALEAGISPVKLAAAAKALLRSGQAGLSSQAAARAAVKVAGRASSTAIAKAKDAFKGDAAEFAYMNNSPQSLIRGASTAGRRSTEAYPKSFDGIVGRSTRSSAANQTTPSAENFFQNGRRYVDDRYKYDPISSPRRTQYDPRTGYATQPKTITGPKPGAALNPTGARYAPPRKARGGQR
jgi:hypothetical protein